MNIDIRYYISVFFRRFPIFFVVAALVAVSALSMALMLPTVYEARARLLVESPQIPEEMAASTVQADPGEQLEIFEQRLMTRANLLDIANARQVFAGQGRMSPDETVQAMRDKTTIIRSGARRGQAHLMSISFQATSPTVAAQVANDFVTILLRDSIAFRTDKAEETLAFFQQEVERLSQELEGQSQKILEFKNRNRDALPEELNYRLDRLSTLQERLSQLLRDRTLLAEQRARLVQVFNATGQLDSRGRQLSEAEQELREARRQLAEALAVYSESNPRVKVLRARVARLSEQVGSTGGAPGEESGQTDPQASLLDIQLSEIDGRVGFIDEQIRGTNAELEELRAAIEKTPANSIALEALQREYENIQAQYNGAIERLSVASTGERIELSSRGQRISVLEQATVPTEPIAPNRPKIAIAGILAALLAGAGMIVLLETLNRSVRRGVDLTNALGITPIGVIPYSRTQRQATLRRTVIAGVTIAMAVGIPAGLYYIHTAFMPLDLIAAKVAKRFGV